MEPILYLIARTDIPDMNPGKGKAQSSHATSDFHAWANSSNAIGFRSEYDKWLEDRNFGTVLVKEATLSQIREIFSIPSGYVTHFGETVDPTFPWRNHYGQMFLTEEITEAWFFATQFSNREQLKAIEDLPLHR